MELTPAGSSVPTGLHACWGGRKHEPESNSSCYESALIKLPAPFTTAFSMDGLACIVAVLSPAIVVAYFSMPSLTCDLDGHGGLRDSYVM